MPTFLSFGGGEGAEVIYPLRTSSVLPKAILDAIGENGQIKRKIYQRVLEENPNLDYYYIMRETPNTTALLIEYGFIDNPRDQVKLENNLINYVEGVVKAVSDYIDVDYTPPGGNSMIDEEIYVVKNGDNLYSIALKLGTTVPNLLEYNNLTNTNLSIGQTLLIPPKEIEEEFVTYTVKPGDSLYNIANNYNLTINDLIDYNNLETTVLNVGQILRIPSVEMVSESSNLYTVQKGDTLYSIANISGVSVDTLKSVNNLTGNTLSIGQQLIIPNADVVAEEDYIVYKIQPGDTLYSISKKYNTTVDAIKAYNNLVSNNLTINDSIQIPTITSIPYKYRMHTIASGDTLYSLARLYNTTVDEIKRLNNITSNLLTIGDSIKIPL